MSTVWPDDASLRTFFAEPRTIAVVGLSSRPERASHEVASDLAARGHRVIPVNPALEGPLFGEPPRPDLAALVEEGVTVDMVDVFRRADRAGEVVDEAIRLRTPLGLRLVWLQLGVIDLAAARRAQAAGLTVAMNLCAKIEATRLAGPAPRT